MTDKRARAVRDYLVERGVEAERLEARGYEDSMPIAPNDAPEGGKKSCRIEVVIRRSTWDPPDTRVEQPR